MAVSFVNPTAKEFFQPLHVRYKQFKAKQI